MAILILRTSERKTFRRCRKQWQYTWVDHLVPKVQSSRFRVGNAVHEALDTFYSTPKQRDPDGASLARLTEFFETEQRRVDYDSLDPERQEQFQQDESLADGMVQHYFEYAAQNDTFEVLGTEIQAIVPVNPRVYVSLRVDGLIEDENGERWLLEHKTTSQMDQEAAYLELDDQATTYTWAFQELSEGRGWIIEDGKRRRPQHLFMDVKPVAGILYNFLLKASPQEVKINKDGTPSLTAQIVDADQYEEAVRGAYRLGPSELLPSRYEEMVQKLRARKWFHRLKVYRTEDELANHKEQLLAEAEEIRRAHKREFLRYRNATRDCNWDCAFFELCKGELQNLDMTYFKSESYTVNGQAI